MSISHLDYLQHILHEANYIVRITGGMTEEEFSKDETIQKAVVRDISKQEVPQLVVQIEQIIKEST